jgi:hypothetical protein
VVLLGKHVLECHGELGFAVGNVFVIVGCCLKLFNVVVLIFFVVVVQLVSVGIFVAALHSEAVFQNHKRLVDVACLSQKFFGVIDHFLVPF